MDYLRYAIALGPLGFYWIMVGYLYQRSHPMLLNAAQEMLLLGMGAVGLIAIGPMELFFPNAAYSILGEWTWAFLLCLYAFLVLFLALHRSPQWTIYGLSSEAFRVLLEKVLAEQSLNHSWVGNMLEVPELGVRAIVEPANRSDRAATLAPAGRRQDILGWHRLERWVSGKLGAIPSGKGGASWMVVGGAMLAFAIAMVFMDLERLQAIVTGFLES